MASIYQRGGSYYAQWYDASRRPQKRRLSLRTARRRDAERLLETLERQYRDGDWDPWVQPVNDALSRSRASVNSRQAVDRFVSEKRLNCSGETVKSYRSILDVVARSIGARTALRRITSDQLRNVIYGPRLAPSTRHQRYRVVRVFLNWCRHRRLITASPLGGVPRPPAAAAQPRAVRYEDLERICAALIRDYEGKLGTDNPSVRGRCREGDLIWLCPLFKFAFLSGMRVSELARLKWSHIDIARRRVLIAQQKSRRVSLLPLSQPATEILQALPRRQGNPFVFSSPRSCGDERSTAGFVRHVSMMFTRYRKAAGIATPLSFHGLRHGFCSLLAERGESAHVIRIAARHSSLAVSQRYVDFADEHIRTRLDHVFNTTIDNRGGPMPS